MTRPAPMQARQSHRSRDTYILVARTLKSARRGNVTWATIRTRISTLPELVSRRCRAEYEMASAVCQPGKLRINGPHTAKGGKYRPKPVLPTAHAIECRPTSKRSDKLINKTLPGISLGLRL